MQITSLANSREKLPEGNGLFIIIITISIIIIIKIFIIIMIIIINIIELTHSKILSKSKTFLNILSLANKTVFWTFSAVMPVSFNLLPNCLGIAPKKRTTNV